MNSIQISYNQEDPLKYELIVTGSSISEQSFSSGNLLVDWIDSKLYLHKNETDADVDISLWSYLLVEQNSWCFYEINDLEFVIPYNMDKPSWTLVEIQREYKSKKDQLNNNPFKNFI